MEFSTTREPNGAIKTATPGYSEQSPVGAGGDFGSVIADLLRRRLTPQGPPPNPLQGTGARAVSAPPSYRPSMGSAPMPKTSAPRGRYSYAFSGPAYAGTAPHLPNFVGEGQEGRDFIMEGGPQNWRGAPSPDPARGNGPAMDPRMIALQQQQRASGRM